MKNNLRTLSIIAFVIAIPALIITDWYYKDYGVFVMFLFITVGLVLDQVIHQNKLLNICALVLFVQAPMGLIYGNRAVPKLGFWLLVIMGCGGVILTQIAKTKSMPDV